MGVPGHIDRETLLLEALTDASLERFVIFHQQYTHQFNSVPEIKVPKWRLG